MECVSLNKTRIECLVKELQTLMQIEVIDSVTLAFTDDKIILQAIMIPVEITI